MKLALSTCGKKVDEALFAAMAAAGIDAVEISLSKDETDALNYKETDSLSKRYGVKLWSFHLPFMPFGEIDISNPELAAETVRYLERIIDRASEIGIHTFVIHPSGEPIPESDRETRMACAKESLASLAAYAAARGGTIAVEDLPRACLGRDSREISELLGADERLGVCFDTNHLLSEDIGHFIRAVGDRIVTTHVSDYDFEDEKHWMPGEGSIDWRSVIGALREVGYDGYLLYELGFKAPRTMPRERDLEPRDFAENFKWLMGGNA